MEHIGEHRQIARILIIIDALFNMSRTWYNPKYHSGDEWFYDLSCLFYDNMTALVFWIDRNIRRPGMKQNNSKVTAISEYWDQRINLIWKEKKDVEKMLFHIACMTEAMALCMTDVRALCKDIPLRRLEYVRRILNRFLVVFYEMYDENQIAEKGMEWYNESFEAKLTGLHGGDKSKRQNKKNRKKKKG